MWTWWCSRSRVCDFGHNLFTLYIWHVCCGLLRFSFSEQNLQYTSVIIYGVCCYLRRILPKPAQVNSQNNLGVLRTHEGHPKYSYAQILLFEAPSSDIRLLETPLYLVRGLPGQHVQFCLGPCLHARASSRHSESCQQPPQLWTPRMG